MLNDSAGGYVYVVEAVGSGWVKIGLSVSPMERLDTLQTGCPHPLRIRACFWASDPKELENLIHESCKDNRGIGEWFSVDSPVVRRLMSAARLCCEAKNIRELEMKVAALQQERDDAVKKYEWIREAGSEIPF